MKPKYRSRQHLGTIVLALSLGVATLSNTNAAQLTWDSGTGATNNWSTGEINWDNTADGVADTAWIQDSDALFSETAETVTVTTNNNFNNITFGITGYTIAGGAGNLDIDSTDNASSITVTTAGHTATIAEVIRNNAGGATAGSLTKNGAGTLILGGVNTYTGGTTVSAGILQLTQLTGATATGTFSLGGGTLQINQAGNNFGYAPTIGLSADSTFSNIGAGAINYTGTLTGNSHALNVNSGVSRLYINSTTSGITQFNVTSGAMGFDLNVGNRGGGAAVVVSNGASLYFANANTTLANNITLNGGVGLGGVGALFQEGTANATLSGILTLNSTSTIGGSGTGNVTLSGKVTGAGGLTKIGSNNYILTNSANDYSGTTTITSGTLTLNGNTGVLPSNATINGGGGTFSYQGATAGSTLDASGYTLGGDLTIQSTYGTSGNTQVTLASATRTAGSTFNYAVSGGTNGTTNKIVFNTAPSTGVLLDKGLFFNGSNYAAYDTGGFVRAYSYSTDSNGATSTGGATLGSVTGKNVDLTTAAVTAQTTDSINTLRLGTTFGVTMAAGNTLTVDGILKSGGNAATITGGTGIQASSGSEMVIRTNASTDTLTISTPILANGASSLTKSGAGTAVLLSSNTYTGGTTVAGGTLQVGNSTNATASGSTTSLGAADSTVTVNAGTLRFQMGQNSSNALDQNFVFNTGSTLNYNDGKLTFGSATAGTASNSRTITVNGSTTWNPLWTQKQFVMAGVVQGSGDINIVRPGAANAESGYVAFVNDTNTYSGTITTNGSIGTATTGNATGIIVGTTNTLQYANIVNNTLNSTSSASGLTFLATSAKLGSLAGAGNFILGQNTAGLFLAPNETTSSTAVALTVGGNNASTTYSGQMSGLGSLTKAGTGTMTLSGANTYTGATTVNAGTLKVSGSIGNSAVTVATNATLASGTNGTIGSSVSVSSNGKLAAGGVGAIGTATVGTGGLALSSGSIFSWDLNGATGSLPTADPGSYDKVVANGAMSGTSVFNVVLGISDFTDTFWDSTHTWSDIFTGSGVPADLAAIFTSFSGTNVNTDGSVTSQGGFSFNNSSTLTWSAVPEPSSALTGLLVTAGLLRRRRKN